MSTQMNINKKTQKFQNNLNVLKIKNTKLMKKCNY